MNVENYECHSSSNLDASNKDIHTSDPELDTIPYRYEFIDNKHMYIQILRYLKLIFHRIGTLDRRVAFKSNRPRSLDLSSWSVESKASSQTTSSSDGSQVRMMMIIIMMMILLMMMMIPGIAEDVSERLQDSELRL